MKTLTVLVSLLLLTCNSSHAQYNGGVDNNLFPLEASLRVRQQPVLRSLSGKMDNSQRSMLFRGHAQFFDQDTGADPLQVVHLKGKSTDRISPDTPIRDLPPEEQKEVLDARWQRSQAQWDGTYVSAPEPRETPSIQDVTARLQSQEQDSKRQWAGIYVPHDASVEPISIGAAERQLDDQRQRAEAVWGGIDSPTLPDVNDDPVEMVAGRLRKIHDDAEAQELALSKGPVADPVAPSLSDVAKKLDKQNRTSQDLLAGNYVPAVDTPTRKPSRGKHFQRTLSWDEWYQEVADRATSPLLKALAKQGNPAGYARALITVWPDHHLVVEPVGPADTQFARAIVAAYRSLDGSPGLEYPLGSHRTVVSFVTENWHDIPGQASGVHSRPLKGDHERLAFDW